MLECNCKEYDYTYQQVDGLGHEWAFWDAQLREFLKYVGVEPL